MLFSLFLVLIILTAPSSSALENATYEEYCFSGLMYLMGERAEELKVKSIEEFLNNSEMIHFGDTPLTALSPSNEFGKRHVNVYVYNNVINSSENVDMLFYYTDMYGGDYKFFGCAITSNNLSVRGVIYDTINAMVIPHNVSIILWNTSFVRRSDPTPINTHIFSDSITNEIEIKTEKVIINDIIFNLLKIYVDKSSLNPLIRWQANLTLLVPYVEELPGKRAWDNYVKFRNTDMATPIDRKILRSVKENKTTQIRIPNLEPIEPKRESPNYVLISQTIIAVLITIVVFYLIIKKRQELKEWKGEDEYR